MARSNNTRHMKPAVILALWSGWILGPMGWAAHQNVSYGLVYWVCDSGEGWIFYLATVVALAIAASGGVLSWRAGKAASTGAADTQISRSHFIASVGSLIALLSAVGILVETIPVFGLNPCAGAT